MGVFSWFKLAIILVQIADKIADILREKGQMDAGRDMAIAESAASILSKTSVKDEIVQRMINRTEAETDQDLKDLEPK